MQNSDTRSKWHSHVLLFAVLFSISANAQTEAQFTQFMYNRFLFNPAYAGADDAGEVYLLHRSQYVQLSEKAIASQGFNFNMPLHAISSGIGLTAINDFIGHQRSTYVSMNYDYRKVFGWGKLAIGAGLGFVNTSLAGDKLRAPDGSYEDGGVNHNDALLPNTSQQGWAPDFSFGVYLSSSRYFTGLSLYHIAFSEATVNGQGSKMKLKFARNFYASGGYEFTINSKLSLMPSVLLKSDFRKVQMDIGITTTALKIILAGISFRGYGGKSLDALAFMAGVRFRGVQVLYSYDINISNLNQFNNGSHEISLSYKFKLRQKDVRGFFHHNPRYI